MTCGSEVSENRLLRALITLINLCASGHLPLDLAEYFTSAILLPLKKKSDPDGVRPIACGESLRHAVEGVILQKVQAQAVEHVGSLQVGVGVKDATSHVALACSRLLPALKVRSARLLQLDLSNAFNTVSRQAI